MAALLKTDLDSVIIRPNEKQGCATKQAPKMTAITKARVTTLRLRLPKSPKVNAITMFLEKVAALRKSALSTESWLLKHGRAWTPAPLPEGIERGLEDEVLPQRCRFGHQTKKPRLR